MLYHKLPILPFELTSIQGLTGCLLPNLQVNFDQRYLSLEYKKGVGFFSSKMYEIISKSMYQQLALFIKNFMSRFSHFTFKSEEGLIQGMFQQAEANTNI